MRKSNLFSANSASVPSANEDKLVQDMFDMVMRETCIRTAKYGFLTEQDKEDIFMTIFSKVWAARETYDPGRRKMETWVSRIAHNAICDYIDKWIRTNGATVSVDDEAYGHEDDKDSMRGFDSSVHMDRPATYWEAEGESSLIRAEDEQHLRNTISRLPEGDQRVIEMVENGWASDAMALELGCTENAVYGRVFKAKTRLGNALGHAGRNRKARRGASFNQDSLPVCVIDVAA